MDQSEALRLILEHGDRSRMLMSVLYATAERCGTQHEAFYSLQLLNDLSYRVADVARHPGTTPETAVELMAEVNVAISEQITRLDTEVT